MQTTDPFFFFFQEKQKIHETVRKSLSFGLKSNLFEFLGVDSMSRSSCIQKFHSIKCINVPWVLASDDYYNNLEKKARTTISNCNGLLQHSSRISFHLKYI